MYGIHLRDVYKRQIVYYPYTQTEDKPEYYYVYAKLPQQLQEKGDYFNQADS